MNINANPIGQDRYGSRIAINLISRSQRSPRSSGINRKREGESDGCSLVGAEKCRLFAQSVNLGAHCFIKATLLSKLLIVPR